MWHVPILYYVTLNFQPDYIRACGHGDARAARQKSAGAWLDPNFCRLWTFEVWTLSPRRKRKICHQVQSCLYLKCTNTWAFKQFWHFEKPEMVRARYAYFFFTSFVLSRAAAQSCQDIQVSVSNTNDIAPKIVAIMLQVQSLRLIASRASESWHSIICILLCLTSQTNTFEQWSKRPTGA